LSAPPTAMVMDVSNIVFDTLSQEAPTSHATCLKGPIL
jgi:hypothetical protein